MTPGSARSRVYEDIGNAFPPHQAAVIEAALEKYVHSDATPNLVVEERLGPHWQAALEDARHKLSVEIKDAARSIMFDTFKLFCAAGLVGLVAVVGAVVHLQR